MPDHNNEIVHPSEITIKEIILNIRVWLKYLFSKWIVILSFALLGAVIGIIKNKSTTAQYVAKCHFILEEGGSPSPMSGLALLGLSNGTEGSTGLFSGNNLIWLYNSRLTMQHALLSNSGVNQKLFIKWFLEIDDKAKKIDAYQKVNFSEYNDTLILSKTQNEIMSFAIDRIVNKYLKVENTPKTENIITVTVTAPDESFSKLFNDKLVETVNNYYIYSKTKKLRDEVASLQDKVDNMQVQMNRSMVQTASAADATPFPNPSRKVLAVASQRKNVDVQINSALYSEIVKNLETSKMTLTRATPLIQVLEEPRFPLGVVKRGFWLETILFSILFMIIGFAILIPVKWYSNIMKEK